MYQARKADGYACEAFAFHGRRIKQASISRAWGGSAAGTPAKLRALFVECRTLTQQRRCNGSRGAPQAGTSPQAQPNHAAVGGAISVRRSADT
jgi:hypothetical protein